MASFGKNSRIVLVALAVVIAALWTAAAVITLAYWSGFLFWIAVVLEIGAIVWVVKVYLRPTQPQDSGGAGSAPGS